SMSVCAVGSRSSRSSAWPTTSTVDVAPASASVRSTVIGTPVRTFTSRSSGWNPCAPTLMWYGLGARLLNTYLPPASVVVVRLKPDTALLILTSTACITPPVGSFTVPCTVPAPPSPWALAGRPANEIRATTQAAITGTDVNRRAHICITPLSQAKTPRPSHLGTLAAQGEGARPQPHGWFGGSRGW